jgi:hypothetical protein
MTIFTQHRVRQSLLEDFEAPLGDVLGAQAQEAWTYNPLPSVMRRRELSRAYRGAEPNFLDINPFGEEAPSTASPMVDASAARQRIKDEGLDLVVPDAGIRQRALDILIERKKEERRRNDILSRAPSGLTAGAARIGTALAASALDPLNVASAFIPVVGPTRYAAMLQRARTARGPRRLYSIGDEMVIAYGSQRAAQNRLQAVGARIDAASLARQQGIAPPLRSSSRSVMGVRVGRAAVENAQTFLVRPSQVER